MDWCIHKSGYNQEEVADNGNRFLIGNGYLGVRGTLEEDTKESLVAINLAGIYDQVGSGWREPLNAPNVYFTQISVGDKILQASDMPIHHEQQLDYQFGIRKRTTKWQIDGCEITLVASRFVSMDDPHILGLSYEITSNTDKDITLISGIDGDVWDIHGPHYTNIIFGKKEDVQYCHASLQNDRESVVAVRVDFISDPKVIGTYSQVDKKGLTTYKISLQADKKVKLNALSVIYTSRDILEPEETAMIVGSNFTSDSYDLELTKSKKAWEKIWQVSAVKIISDEYPGEETDAEEAINYSLYHLNIIAPRHRDDLSIAARGLSGQTYKGAIFWDSEIFMLDYFLHTQPEVARSMVKYRIDTLSGALKKAASYGLLGAFYAWESQEGGYDACSDYNVTDVFTKRPVRTYFKDKQVHISSAIVWAIMHYVDYTDDQKLILENGGTTILECARFYWSLLSSSIMNNHYDINDVIGPDEYHERVNNNAYTNKMALYTFDSAIAIVERLKAYNQKGLSLLQSQISDFEELLGNIVEARSKLYIPKPNEAGIIEQFDGYFKLEDITPQEAKSRLVNPREYWGGTTGVASDTQVIKQADVVTMLEMFHQDYSKDILSANWAYYEPRTEHGSSLSACMYAMLACRIGEVDKSYPFFMKSASAEIRGGGKQWAGLVYIGGTHPAAAGGAWKNLVQGFAGLSFESNKPKLKPNLPSHWKALSFSFVYKGELYRANITRDKEELVCLGKH